MVKDKILKIYSNKVFQNKGFDLLKNRSFYIVTLLVLCLNFTVAIGRTLLYIHDGRVFDMTT